MVLIFFDVRFHLKMQRDDKFDSPFSICHSMIWHDFCTKRAFNEEKNVLKIYYDVVDTENPK